MNSKNSITDQEKGAMVVEKEKKTMGGFVGNLYQVKLLMLFICRGLNLNYEFELGTEIDEAEKFDDSVFRYKNGERDHFILVQAKYSIDNGKRIPSSGLFTIHDSNFGILKYFNSFLKVKYSKFISDGVIENVIVYTNIRFESSFLKHLEKIDSPESTIVRLCSFEDEGEFYTFKPEFLLRKLKPLIVEYSYTRIAERLVELLVQNEPVIPIDAILKDFHCVLAKEVIDVETGEFRKTFIEGKKGDSDEIKYFRKILVKALKKKKRNLSIDQKFNLMENFGSPKEMYRIISEIDSQFCDDTEMEKRQKWPPLIITNDGEILDFSRKFCFAVGQPNENNLGKNINEIVENSICSNIADKFLMCMMNWFKGINPDDSESSAILNKRFISSEDARRLFTKMNLNLNKSTLKIPINQLNIRFDDKETKELLKKFTESDNKVLCVISKHTNLSLIKVYQILEDLVSIDFIILRLFLLDQSLMKHGSIKSFESKLCDHPLLVIECNEVNNIADIQLEEIISKILMNNDKKKVIFIKRECNEFGMNIERKFAEKYMETHDDKLCLENLNRDSQEVVLDRTSVDFLGKDVRCSEIISKKSRYLINGNILANLLNNEKIKIGSQYEPKTCVADYYIQRKFYFEFDCKIDGNISCVLLICGFTEDDLQARTINIDEYSIDINVASEESASESETLVFIECCENNRGKKVCLLRKDENKIYFLKHNRNFSLEPSKIKNILNEAFRKNIILLASDPGMGKSSVFNSLCTQIQNQNSSFWTYKIDLNNLSNTLESIQNKKNSDESEILTLFLKSALKLSEFEFKIFENHLEEGKVVLLLDGIDEVSPNYQNEAVNILKTLINMKKNKQLFISTRPHRFILNDVRNKLNVLSSGLQPFTNDDQKEFLKKIWKFNSNSKLDEESFNSFVNNLLTNLSRTLKDDEMIFSRNALHLMMVSVSFEDKFNSFFLNGSIQNNDQLTFNLTNLYEKFIEKKHTVYYNEKRKIDMSHKDFKKSFADEHHNFIEKNKLLSLSSLFEDDQIISILSTEEQTNLKKYTTEILEDGDNIGIIVDIRKGKPTYVHKTFAEYFAAKFFISKLSKSCDKLNEIHSFFFKEILTDRNRTIARFIDENMDNGKLQLTIDDNTIKSLNESQIFFSIENNLDNIGKLIIESKMKLGYCIPGHEKLLCLASSKNYDSKSTVERKVNILELLLKNADSETLKKSINIRETPLLTAVKYGCLNNMIILIEKLKELDIVDEAFREKNNDKQNIIHLAAVCYDESILVLLLDHMSRKTVILKELIQNEDYMDKTPLLMAISGNHLNNVNILLKKLEELDIVNEALQKKDCKYENIFHNLAVKTDESTLLLLFDYMSTKSVMLKEFFQDKNWTGRTPLLMAVSDGCVDNVKTLLKKLEELDVVEKALQEKDIENNNIIHIAGKRQDDIVLTFLFDYMQNKTDVLKELVQNKNKIRQTPLFTAISEGCTDSINVLLKKLEEFDIVEEALQYKDYNDNNIFHMAAERCDKNVLSLLLDHTNDRTDIIKSLMQCKNKDGKTPLFSVVFHDELNNVNILLEILNRLNIVEEVLREKDCKDRNIIHVAATRSDDKILTFLINEFGISKEFMQNQDRTGKTPLFSAILDGCLNNVNILLKKFEELDVVEEALQVKDIENNNIFHTAVKRYNEDILLSLLDYMNDRPDMLKELIRDNESGETPLISAIGRSKIDYIEKFLGKLDKLNIIEDALEGKDSEDRNVIHVAVKRHNENILMKIVSHMFNRTDMLKKLLQNKDKMGKTPLLMAIASGSLNSLSILLKILERLDVIEEGLQEKDCKDNNIFHIIGRIYNKKILSLLLEYMNKRPDLFKQLMQSKNEDGQTPLVLMNACNRSNMRILLGKLKELNIIENMPTDNYEKFIL